MDIPEENQFLPAELRRGDPAAPGFAREHGNAAAEYRLFRALRVDGVLSDFPAEAAALRAAEPMAPALP